MRRSVRLSANVDGGVTDGLACRWLVTAVSLSAVRRLLPLAQWQQGGMVSSGDAGAGAPICAASPGARTGGGVVSVRPGR